MLILGKSSLNEVAMAMAEESELIDKAIWG